MNYELPSSSLIIKESSWAGCHGIIPAIKEPGMLQVQQERKKSGATVTAWIAIFLPYKLLIPLPQVPPVSGTKWRANMYRIDHDNGSSQFSWQKTTGSFHEYNSFGTFFFE
jgi:hypothetical protein